MKSINHYNVNHPSKKEKVEYPASITKTRTDLGITERDYQEILGEKNLEIIFLKVQLEESECKIVEIIREAKKQRSNELNKLKEETYGIMV